MVCFGLSSPFLSTVTDHFAIFFLPIRMQTTAVARIVNQSATFTLSPVSTDVTEVDESESASDVVVDEPELPDVELSELSESSSLVSLLSVVPAETVTSDV